MVKKSLITIFLIAVITSLGSLSATVFASGEQSNSPRLAGADSGNPLEQIIQNIDSGKYNFEDLPKWLQENLGYFVQALGSSTPASLKPSIVEPADVLKGEASTQDYSSPANLPIVSDNDNAPTATEAAAYGISAGQIQAQGGNKHTSTAKNKEEAAELRKQRALNSSQKLLDYMQGMVDTSNKVLDDMLKQFIDQNAPKESFDKIPIWQNEVDELQKKISGFQKLQNKEQKNHDKAYN